MGCGCSSDIKSSRTEITLPRRTNIIKQSNSRTKQKCVNVLVTLENGQTRDHYSNLIIKMRKPLFVYLGEECVHHQGYRRGQRVEFNWKAYSAAEERFINMLYDLGRRQKLTENIILQHFAQFTSDVRSETKYSNQSKVIFVEGPRMYSDYTFIGADPVNQPSNITNINMYSESWTNITTPMFNDIRQSRFNDERQRRDRVRDFTEEILLLIGNTRGSEDMTKSIYEQVLQQLQLDLIARVAEHRNFSDEELQNLLREYIREIQQNIRFQAGHPENSTNAGNIFVIPISTTINAENQSGDSDERNSWKQKDSVWRNIIRTEITSLRHLCETREEKILLITLENEYLHQIMKNIANKNTDFDYKEGTLTKSFNERKNQMKQKAQDERIQNNTEMKQLSDQRKKRHKVPNVKTETDASQTSNGREKRNKKKRKEGMSTKKDPSETSEYMDKKKGRKEGMSYDTDCMESSDDLDKKARTVDRQTDGDSRESPSDMNKMRKKERKDRMSTDTDFMESSDDLDKKAQPSDMQILADSRGSPANMNKMRKKGRKDGMSTDTDSMESSDDLDKKTQPLDLQTGADSRESPANINKNRKKGRKDGMSTETDSMESSDDLDKKAQALDMQTDADSRESPANINKMCKKGRKDGMSTDADSMESSDDLDKKAQTVDMQTGADSRESPANINKMRKKGRKDGMSTDADSMESSDDLDKKAQTVDMQTGADSRESPANINKMRKKGRKDGMSTDADSMESSDDLDKKAQTVDMQTGADSRESQANINKMPKKGTKDGMSTDTHSMESSDDLDKKTVDMQTDADSRESPANINKMRKKGRKDGMSTDTDSMESSDDLDKKAHTVDIQTDADSRESPANMNKMLKDSDVNTQTEERQSSENVDEIQTALGVKEQTDGDSKQSSENMDEMHTVPNNILQTDTEPVQLQEIPDVNVQTDTDAEESSTLKVPNNILQTDTEPVQLQEIFQKIDEDVIAELTQVQKDNEEETNSKSKDEVLENYNQEQMRSIFQEYDRKEDHIYELEGKDVQTITKEEIEENNQKLKESIEGVEDIEEITRKVKEHKQVQQKLVLRAQKGGEVIKDIKQHLQDICEESQIDVPGLYDGDAYLENSSQTVQETDRVEEELLNDLNNMQRNTAHLESTEDRRKLLNEFLDTEIETILKMEEEGEIQKDQQVASSVNGTNEESTHSVADEEEYEKSLLNDGDFEFISSDEERENKGKESEDSLSLKNREERQKKLRQELINLKDEVIQNVNGPLSEDELKQKLKDHRSKQQALLDKMELSKESKRRRLMEEKSRFSSATSDENEIYTDSQIPSSMTQDSDTQTETLKVLTDNEEDFVKKFCEIGVDTHCEPDGDQPIDTKAVVEKYLKAQTNVMERAASDKEKEIQKLREKVADLQEKLERKDKEILKEEVEKLHEHVKSEIIENTEVEDVKHKLDSHRAKRNAFLQQFEEKKNQRQKKLQDAVKKAMQSEQQQEVGESPSEIENDEMPKKEDGSTSPDRHTPDTRKMPEDGTNETFENLSRKNEKLKDIIVGKMKRKRTVIDEELRPNERSNTLMFPRDTENPEE